MIHSFEELSNQNDIKKTVVASWIKGKSAVYKYHFASRKWERIE
tara:strand:+ start:559 stop:690 length:132 start_codon:yes stop_codon:yes gene_type:complete